MYVQDCFIFIADERSVAAFIEQPERLSSAYDARVIAGHEGSQQFEITIRIATDAELHSVVEGQGLLLTVE